MAERGEAPSPKRPRVDNTQQGSSKKYSGASKKKSKFQASWQKRWPCVTPVNNNPHSFHCTLCKKVVSCGHQGERDVTRYIASVQHKRNAEAVKTTHLEFCILSIKGQGKTNSNKLQNMLKLPG